VESGPEDEVKDGDEDGDALKGVKTSGPEGEEDLHVDNGASGATKGADTGRQKEKADVVAQKGFVVE
jgi:hypothetical protein